MRSTTSLISVAFAVVALLPACGGDDAPASPGSGGGSSAQCDEPDSEHEQLINAPTESVVVKKTVHLPAIDE
jgi:hypothetical protein